MSGGKIWTVTEMLVIRDHAVFCVDDAAPILATLPTARHAVKEGKSYVAVPHDVEHLSVMRSFGLNAPSPILHRYDWPGKYTPYAHQRETAKFLTENKRAYNLSSMGSGKTSATAWAADFLMREGVVRRAIIAAPLSCLERVWGDELFKNFPHRRFVVLHGHRQTRLDLLKKDWDFAVINHHGLKIIADSVPADVDLLIFDELAVLRNHSTALWKAAKKMVKPHHWVWGLTGTPTPNAPTDAWAQSKLITPERYSGSFTRFKVDTMVQLGPFRFMARRNAEQTVNQILQPSIRYALEDCVDLPETIYSDRDAEMSAEQKHHYEKLRKECATTVKGLEVTAVNAAVLMGKLIQAAVGTVYGDGEKAELDFGPRLEVIKECIEEAGGKVIVFAPLTGYLHALHNKLKKYYKCAVIEGSTSAGKRNEIFQEFQHGDGIQVLLANPGTMAHGLTLTAAATTIWAAPITSHEIYLQACARIVRPGQKKVTNIIHISASPVERKVYQALKEKSKFQDALLAVVKEK